MPAELATPATLAEHPLVRSAEALAAELLVPQAQHVDMYGLPASHVDAVRRAGLIGLSGLSGEAESGPAPAVVRAVTETLSGACGTTWFVIAQHGLPLAMVDRSTNADLRTEFLQPLASAEILAGAAFAQVRRPGPPTITARPAGAGAGWVLDGTLDWFTSWGLAGVFLLAAQAGDDLLFFLVDAREQPGLSAGDELALAAMGGTHTTSLHISGLRLGADRLIDVVPRARWLAGDAIKTANANPAVFGILRAVIAELEQTAARRRSADMAELAGALDAQGGRLRTAAYELIDDVPADQLIPERLDARAAATGLAIRASAALIAAQAGAAMLCTSPAQRWAREALFHQVQAQTAAVRAAQIREFSRLCGGG